MKLPKFLRLPTPVEIGKSDYNALPMEGFGAKPGDYTWDIYYKEMKDKYPIKYFLTKTVPELFGYKIITPLENFKYWVVSHTIRKYHLLDIRNKENDYSYGWIDADLQLLYSVMAIMENFIIEQDTPKRLIWLKEELQKDPECKEFNWNESIKFCEELLAIQKWWRIDRPKDIELSLEGPPYDFGYDERIRNKDDEMMKKIIDIRGRMWT